MGIKKTWTVQYNRDSGLWAEIAEPATLAGLHAFLDPILDHCDTYLLDPGALVQFWPSAVREMFGLDAERWQRFGDSSDPGIHGGMPVRERQRRNLLAIHAITGNPVAAVLDRCRERGVRCGLSYRMNDKHSSELDDHPSQTRWRREHLDTCFFDQYTHDAGTVRSLNFAVPAVREECLRLLQEYCDVFRMDVLDLDFMRRPPHFPGDIPRQEQFRCMNELVREVRRATTQAGIALQVRLPPTVELCESNGLDIRTWASEGWVDAVSVSPGFYMEFDLTLADYRAVFGDRSIALYAGCEKRLAFAGDMRSRPVTHEMYRAAFTHYRRQGIADGMYFFNLYGNPAVAEPDVLREARDPESVFNREKTWLLPPRSERRANEGHVRALPLPADVPAAPQEGLTVPMTIADDLAARPPCVIRLGLRFQAIDRERLRNLRVEINGRPLDTPLVLETRECNTMARQHATPIIREEWAVCDLDPEYLKDGDNCFRFRDDADTRLPPLRLLMMEVNL